MTMQIAHVGLRNLRSYRSAELHLGPGTTLLSGDIGSGKTSLLYAMEMALFGFAEVDPGYLIRHGAKDAEVSLTLSDGTHRWELRRRFVRRIRKGRDTFEPTENSLAVDGQRANYSATELRRRTIELLGFPDNPNPRAHSDVWRWAVYLAQERMRDVLDPDVDVRMETVRKALGVEQYRLAGENARGLARSLQERAVDLAEQGARHRGVEDEAAQWRAAEALSRGQLAALEAREASLRVELTQARVDLDQLEVQRREFEAARETVAHEERLSEELDRSLQQDASAVESSQAHLLRLEADRRREAQAAASEPESAPPIESLRLRRTTTLREMADLEALRGEASGVEEQLGLWTQREHELKARRAATLRELTKVQADRCQLEAEEPRTEPPCPVERTQTELAAERTKLEEARRTADRRLATAMAELQELAELVQEGMCPRCHRPVEAADFEAHQGEQSRLVADLRREVDHASDRVRAAEERAVARLEYDRAHDRWHQLDSRRADLRQRERALEARGAEEEGVRTQLDEEAATLESRRARLAARLQTYERVRAELARLDQEIVDTEERARAAAARAERLAALEEQIPSVRADIELRRRSQADRRARREEVRRKIEAARARLKGPGDLEERWKNARRNVEVLAQSLEGALRETSEPRAKLAEASARLDELVRRRRERETLERRATELGRLSHWMDHDFRNAMLELEQRRLHQGRLQFERRFAQYFAALVEDPSLSARVDETFAPWVDIAGQATPAEALSGGERTAMALAYRLALGRTVREAGRLTLETLILDEPTEGFSQEQTLRMGDLLESLGLPQVILVSHERPLEGIADRVVRIRKRAGVSFIEQTDPASEADETASSPAPEILLRPPAEAPRRRIRRLSDLETSGAGDGSAQVK